MGQLRDSGKSKSYGIIITPYHIAKMAPSAVTPASAAALPVRLSKANGQGAKGFQPDDVDTTSLVLRTFRCLIADLCEQFKGGHPG